MAEPFLGELRVFSFGFAPRNWAMCAGQLLPINQNQALFALLGVQFGGNGVQTFALPDLRGQIPIHFGQQGGGSAYTIGQRGGVTGVTLNSSQTGHTHIPSAATTGTANSPAS